MPPGCHLCMSAGPPLSGLYMGATRLPYSVCVSMLRKMSACMAQRWESWLPSGSPAERKPCPLTLSVSFKHFIGCVKHLSLWGLWNCGREGGGGGDRWTDKSGFAVIVGLPVWGVVRFGSIPFKTPIKKKHASLCQLTHMWFPPKNLGFFCVCVCSSINSNIFLKTYLSSYANWSMMIHVCHTTQKHKCKHKQAHTHKRRKTITITLCIAQKHRWSYKAA